jgi:hypothetical protein
MQFSTNNPGSNLNPDDVQRFENCQAQLRSRRKPQEGEAMTDDADEIKGIKVVNAPTRILTEVQFVDYSERKSDLIEWLLDEGKHPDRAEGYAQSTISPVSQKTDRLFRWLWWEKEG